MGLMAGYFGRWIDGAIMRFGEVTSAFPEIFLVLIIIASVKPPVTQWVRGLEDSWGVDIVRLGIVDYTVLALALAIFSWFGMARLVRGQVLQARENQYVEAARSVGGSTPRILLRHVLPNVMGPVIVVVSAGLGTVAGSEIFLSFLGIGIQPPTPSLGLMIFENGNISVLRTNPSPAAGPRMHPGRPDAMFQHPRRRRQRCIQPPHPLTRHTSSPRNDSALVRHPIGHVKNQVGHFVIPAQAGIHRKHQRSLVVTLVLTVDVWSDSRLPCPCRVLTRI